MKDTLARRWAALKPHVRSYGAEGPDRPAVLLFHGCGGVRSHLDLYARAAAAEGWAAFIVDSYAARGWSRARALATVCTGVSFWGSERAGDVLAAAWGVGRDGRADPSRVALAGWSHGAWSVMDLMTMPLVRPGEAGLADPGPEPLDGLRGLFLVYPYGGFGALSRVRPWRRAPRTEAVLALRDHVTSAADARRLHQQARRCGAEVVVHEVDATHSFDEETGVFPMRHEPPLLAENVERFRAFLGRL